MITGQNVSASFNEFLVKLHDASSVMGLAREKTPEAIKELSDIIIGALGADLSPEEAELAADVLVSLAKKLEKQIRRGLAIRLSAIKNIPLRLALYLANDEIDVSGPFLEHSQALTETDLYYIIQGQGPDHWAAIAKRGGLSAEIVHMLAEKFEFYTSRNLLNNRRIDISKKSVLVLKNFVEQNKELIREFVKRKEVTQDIMRDLYWSLNEEERAMVNQINREGDDGFEESEIDAQMQDAAQDFMNVVLGNLTITQEMQQTATQIKERGLLNVQKLIGTLKEGQIGLFYSLLSEFTGLELKLLDRILTDEDGSALAIFCKNFEFDRSAFVAFFVQVRRARKVKNADNHNALYKAVNFFNRVTKDSASKLMEKMAQQAA